MYSEDEFVEKFQQVGRDATFAKERFSAAKDWYLTALVSSEGMTALEYRACRDELDRRMSVLSELERRLDAVKLVDNTPDAVFVGVLETLSEMVRRMVELTDWVLSEGDRLGLPR